MVNVKSFGTLWRKFSEFYLLSVSEIIGFYLNLVPQFLHIGLFISWPIYLLHEGHLQLKALNTIKAVMSKTCAPKILFFENSPKRSGRL